MSYRYLSGIWVSGAVVLSCLWAFGADSSLKKDSPPGVNPDHNILSRESGNGDFLLLDQSQVAGFSTAQIEILSQQIADGTPVVVYGDGEELRQKLQITNTARPGDSRAVVAYGYRMLPGSVPSEAYWIENFEAPTIEEHSVELKTGQSGLPPESSTEGTEFSGKTPSLLDLASDWSRSQPELTAPAEGAWDAAFYSRWQDLTYQTSFILTWDFYVFKLVDIFPEKDFYLVNIRPHTQIVYYTASYSSGVGWYIVNRVANLDYNYFDIGGYRQSTLVEYKPTGTVSGSSVGWSIGGGLSGYTPGLEASYSKSFNLSDVTMTDQSSLAGAYSKWTESYAGPDYSWWPALTQPCANARSSHYSELAAIASVVSDNVNPPNGMKALVNVSNTVYRDYNFHWCYVIYLCWSTDYHSRGYVNQYIQVNYNRAPVITEYNPSNDIIDLQPGNCANFSVTATDNDGTVPVYNWYLDNSLVASGASWQYCPGYDEGGSHAVKAIATDGSASDEQIWTVNLPCLAIPGDVNGTPPIGIPDIVHLVNFVFDKDRPATSCLGTDPGYCWEPALLCQAEINGMSPIGLPDIIHLVNFVFDKDKPVEGCLGTDPGNCWTPVATEACCLPVP